MSVEPQEVHVVMSNDFPDCVFTGEDGKEKAEIYCKERMDFQKSCLKEYESPRIYYRVYSFEANRPGAELRHMGGRSFA